MGYVSIVRSKTKLLYFIEKLFINTVELCGLTQWKVAYCCNFTKYELKFSKRPKGTD